MGKTATAAEAGAAAATGAVVALEVAPFSFPSTATLATAFGALHVAPKGHGLPQGTAVGNELVRKYADAMLMHRLSGDFLEVEALSLEQQFSNWSHFWGDFFSEEGREGRARHDPEPARAVLRGDYAHQAPSRDEGRRLQLHFHASVD